MEKTIVTTSLVRSQAEKGLVPAVFSGPKKKARIGWALLAFLCLGAVALPAAEPAARETVLQEVLAIEKRGFVNFLTSPSELVYAFKTEKKEHPKAWPLTYGPQFFMNFVTRVASGVNDIGVLPWYVRAIKDDTPLTRRFDMPDYAWQKE